MQGSYHLTQRKFVCSDQDISVYGEIAIYLEGNLFLENNLDQAILSEISEYDVPVKILANLQGQFAIVLLNKKEHCVSLIRDQFGMMPLYYSIQGESVIFGTTLAKIIDLLQCPPALNERAIYEYFIFRYISGRDTIFKDIYEVKPGSIVEINRHGRVVEKDYYHFEYSERKNGKEISCSEMFETAFWNSLARQTRDRSDTNISVLSSGGIDSSILVSCATKILQPRFNTYYVGNEGYEHNRVHEVEYLSRLHGTNHRNIFISNKTFAEHLVETIIINEEPLNHPSSVLRNYLCKSVKGEVDVLLSGEGADCFYCGYYIFDMINYFYVKNPIKAFTRALMKLLPISILPKRYNNKAARIKNAFILPPDEFAIFNDLLVCNCKDNVELLLNAKAPHEFGQNYTSLFANYSRENIMDMILYVYQTHFIIEALKTMTKLGNAYHVQHRHPFIDVNMVNSFNHFPWSEKICFFMRKHQVVQLGKKYLPKKFFKKRKEGFGVPLRSWFYDEKGLGRFMALLTDKRTRERGIFNCQYLDQLLDKYHKRTLPDDIFECVIWPIINFELWYRIFIDKDLTGIA